MNVAVNNKVNAYMGGQTQAIKDMFNTKCSEAAAGDLTTWRDVGKGVYDYRISGNLRMVAVKNGDNFNLSAIYSHAPNKGKKLEVGDRVASYG